MSARLTLKQEAFAVAYAKSGNASEAYRDAYNAVKATSKTINEMASRLLGDRKISARIAALQAPALRKAEITVERSLLEDARLAYSDVRKLYKPDGSLIPVHELDDDTAAAIASIEYDKDTGKVSKIKFWDKSSALDKSFKHLGLYEKDNAQQAESLSLRVEIAKPVK